MRFLIRTNHTPRTKDFKCLKTKNILRTRLASLVGITERKTGVSKLGWHGNSTRFDKKNTLFFLFYVTKKKRKINKNGIKNIR